MLNQSQGKLDAREDVIKATTQFGQSLLSSGHFATEEIKEKLVSLASEKNTLIKLWEERRLQFNQCIELQLFLREAEQADGWTSKQEVRMFSAQHVRHDTFIFSDLLGFRRIRKFLEWC